MRFQPGWSLDPATDGQEVAQRLGGWPVRRVGGPNRRGLNLEARASRCRIRIFLRPGRTSRLWAYTSGWRSVALVAVIAVPAIALVFASFFLLQQPWRMLTIVLVAQLGSASQGILQWVYRAELRQAAVLLAAPAMPRPGKRGAWELPAPGSAR